MRRADFATARALAAPPPRGARLPRQDNRRAQLLDAAAKLFGEQGFHATSMRDIAKAVGMLSGSIYYHFDSKDEMLLAVYEEGVRRVATAVADAVARETAPWARLEAACAAHLRGLIGCRDYARVMIQTAPDQAGTARDRVRELRRNYEARFRQLIEALTLPPGVDPRYVRLLLFGALNWSQVWYHPGGDPPEVVARRFIDTLRLPLQTLSEA